jgi:chemotaxis protein CheD
MSATFNAHGIDVFLQPGDWHVGDRGTRIRTILGSCVSVVLWHPERNVGGMCHFMLPNRPVPSGSELDGKYGDEAMTLLLRDLQRTGAHPSDCQAKVFGGANMFPGESASTGIQVGLRNVKAAHSILRTHNLRCVTEHTSGIGHRNLIFDVASGCVWVKQMNPHAIRRLGGDPAPAIAAAAMRPEMACCHA